ncbi:MAG: peptide synthetase [Phycisphaeraceae bacterium]|nr:peptide synthetase [Phycisphaeraceae bacterium]
MEIRRQLTIEDEIIIEGGRSLARPIRKVAAIVVITNPFAGRFVDDLTDLVDAGEALGKVLAERVLKVIRPEEVDSYGKACIVGEQGELEHSAALMHPTFGAPIRKAIGAGKAIIPSTKKIGGPGTRIDIPFFYKDEIYVMSHLDAMEVGLCDAPKADEILLALAMTTGGRPHPRIPGGKKKEEVTA